MVINTNVNGKNVKLEALPDDNLADVLKKAGYSVRQGCDTTNCGLCTIWFNEKAMLSCSIPAFRAEGQKLTTIDGIDTEAKKLAALIAQEGSDQCGFCSPGFIMSVIAMKKELKNPTDEEINEYLKGNLCRCTGYQGQLRAVKKYLEVE